MNKKVGRDVGCGRCWGWAVAVLKRLAWVSVQRSESPGHRWSGLRGMWQLRRARQPHWQLAAGPVAAASGLGSDVGGDSKQCMGQDWRQAPGKLCPAYRQAQSSREYQLVEDCSQAAGHVAWNMGTNNSMNAHSSLPQPGLISNSMAKYQHHRPQCATEYERHGLASNVADCTTKGQRHNSQANTSSDSCAAPRQAMIQNGVQLTVYSYK